MAWSDFRLQGVADASSQIQPEPESGLHHLYYSMSKNYVPLTSRHKQRHEGTKGYSHEVTKALRYTKGVFFGGHVE
jgi:hypothetical protein